MQKKQLKGLCFGEIERGCAYLLDTSSIICEIHFKELLLYHFLTIDDVNASRQTVQ